MGLGFVDDDDDDGDGRGNFLTYKPEAFFLSIKDKSIYKTTLFQMLLYLHV